MGLSIAFLAGANQDATVGAVSGTGCQCGAKTKLLKSQRQIGRPAGDSERNPMQAIEIMKRPRWDRSQFRAAGPLDSRTTSSGSTAISAGTFRLRSMR